jgi:hypothetical protein
VAAIGAEELDLLVPKFLIVTIKLAFTLRAGYPENFRHVSLLVLHHRDAEYTEFGVFSTEQTLGSATSVPPR